MTRFLITGLPRSRTAWWATCTGALHEPISQHGPGWMSEWQGDEGVSDAGAAYYLGFILEKIKPRTLIVERPKAEVIESYKRYFGRDALNWEVVDALLDKALLGLAVESPLIKRVRFDDLARLSVVEDCISWLGAPTPPNLAQLARMRVESDPAWTMAMLRQKAA